VLGNGRLSRLKAAAEIPSALRLAARENMNHRSSGSVGERAECPIEDWRRLHSHMTICLGRRTVQAPNAGKCMPGS
jgi:hypothetical protein